MSVRESGSPRLLERLTYIGMWPFKRKPKSDPMLIASLERELGLDSGESRPPFPGRIGVTDSFDERFNEAMRPYRAEKARKVERFEQELAEDIQWGNPHPRDCACPMCRERWRKFMHDHPPG